MIRYGLRGHEDRSVCTDKEALLRSQDANDRIAMAFMDKEGRGGQTRRTDTKDKWLLQIVYKSDCSPHSQAITRRRADSRNNSYFSPFTDNDKQDMHKPSNNRYP